MASKHGIKQDVPKQRNSKRIRIFERLTIPISTKLDLDENICPVMKSGKMLYI